MFDQDSTPSAEEAEFDAAFEAIANKLKPGSDSEGAAPVTTPAQDEDENLDSHESEEAAPANTKTESTDVFATASEAQRKALADLQAQLSAAQHRASSDAHRVAALTVKTSEQERKLQAFQQQQQQTPEVDDVAQDYPEVAQLVRSEIKRAIEPIVSEHERQTAERQLSELEAAQEAELAETQKAFKRFSEVHPDYLEVCRSPAFSDWKSKQSPGMQALAASSHPDDAIVMLNNYKQTLKSTRSHNLSALEDLPTSSVERTGGGADDFDAAFEAHASKIQRNRNRR
jgi:hypothetical protein